MSQWKAEALAMIQAMPDDVTWEQLSYRISLRAKVERGLADVAAGRGIPHEQVKREMDEWLAALDTEAPEQPLVVPAR